MAEAAQPPQQQQEKLIVCTLIRSIDNGVLVIEPGIRIEATLKNALPGKKVRLTVELIADAG